VRRSHACAAAGLALAAAYWLAADALPRSALADSVGADGVPKLLAGLLAVLSVLIAVKNTDSENLPGSLRALGVAGLGFVYVAMLPLTGYLVGAGLLAAASALYYGARGRVVLLFSICTAVLLWLVFAKALGVALP